MNKLRKVIEEDYGLKEAATKGCDFGVSLAVSYKTAQEALRSARLGMLDALIEEIADHERWGDTWDYAVTAALYRIESYLEEAREELSHPKE